MLGNSCLPLCTASHLLGTAGQGTACHDTEPAQPHKHTLGSLLLATALQTRMRLVWGYVEVELMVWIIRIIIMRIIISLWLPLLSLLITLLQKSCCEWSTSTNTHSIFSIKIKLHLSMIDRTFEKKKAESSSIFLRTYPIYHSLLNTRVSLTCWTARPWGHLKSVVSWAREGRAVCHIALHASIPALALGAWYRRPEIPIIMQGRPFLAWHCWLTGRHKKRNNKCNRVNDSVTITIIVQEGFCSEGEWYRNNSSEEGLMHECFDSPNGARHR